MQQGPQESPQQKKDRSGREGRRTAQMLSAASMMPACALLAGGIGYAIDMKTERKDFLWTAILASVGTLIGIYHVIKELMR
jgi:hypothetical protein